MARDFFDPIPEQQNVVLIEGATLQKAQRMIAGCEACSETAEIPFSKRCASRTRRTSSICNIENDVIGFVQLSWQNRFADHQMRSRKPAEANPSMRPSPSTSTRAHPSLTDATK